MLFLSKITIFNILHRYEDHTTKKKFATRDVTNFNPMRKKENSFFNIPSKIKFHWIKESFVNSKKCTFMKRNIFVYIKENFFESTKHSSFKKKVFNGISRKCFFDSNNFSTLINHPRCGISFFAISTYFWQGIWVKGCDSDDWKISRI